jgi:16S rRNA (guanine527-N7)-methyltransferase
MLGKLELELPEEKLLLLEQFADQLLRWTKRRNLTAITERSEILEKHLVDSLTLMPLVCESRRLLDIGSGAGFPAIPLKIACPDLEVVSVDAVGKKIDFQRHIARTLRLQTFTAIHSRIEELSGDTSFCAGFDLVTARAVTSLSDLVAMAKPFLAPSGRLIAMKGPEGELEFAERRESLQREGWTARLHRLVLPCSGSERSLIELMK